MAPKREATPAQPGDVLGLLDEIKRLMELRGDNPFKIRAYEKAIHNLSGHDDLDQRARNGTLTQIEGIGKGISEVITEFVLKGRSTARDELAKEIPPALLELTQVPGLGPKKAMVLIEKLGIGTIAELEYACKENRLLKIPGFGPKQQQKILEGIQFKASSQGQQKLGDAFEAAEELLKRLVGIAGGSRVSETGSLRRRMEVLSSLDFILETPSGKRPAEYRKRVEEAVESFRATRFGLLPVALHFSEPDRFGFELARTTSSEAHWSALGSPEPCDARTEEELYEKLGLPWIPPEARETGEEVALARAGKLGKLLPWNGVRGVFHNHTNRSDGSATLEQMVRAARDLGFEYIGISDHSKSAFYASGLTEDILEEQHRELREVQEKYPDIRVYWGIESDILADGSLDYDDKVLKRFDFVIASIHSRFKMDRETMTQRVLEAVRNPYTRFLGHATGRLLLGRKGYELDMEKVIAEAARRDVAIEINSHPSRLDIDWRWGAELRRCGTYVSINPDAHETSGLEDTRYGIAMARKALLPSDQVVNSRPADEVQQWLRRKSA